jgi:nitrogen-specific signal transduction histidine kinase
MPKRTAMASNQKQGRIPKRIKRTVVRIAGREHLNLTHLLEEVVSLLKASPVETKTVLLYDLAPDVPLLVADYRQMRRALVSLLHAAAEAINADNGVISLRTQLIRSNRIHLADRFPGEDLAAGQYTLLQIAVSGRRGIDADTRSSIRERLLSTANAGYTLGLAAVRDIVRQHGGCVAITGKPGFAAKIAILLPCGPAEIAHGTKRKLIAWKLGSRKSAAWVKIGMGS